MRHKWIIRTAQFENRPYQPEAFAHLLQHLNLPLCSLIYISATMLFADSCQQIQFRHQHPKVQSQPAGRGYNQSLRWHQLPQRKGIALETRPSILLKYQLKVCVNMYCRYVFLFRQIRGLLMLTRQWQILEKPTKGLKIWTQRLETCSRKSKVKGNFQFSSTALFRIVF